MCDPVTLLVASTVVAAAGQGFSAIQANKQATYQARIADRNAALENEAAQNSQENTRQEALRHYRRVAQLKGEQQSAFAANGIDANFGSASDITDDTNLLSREDVGQIYRQGYETTRGFEINASNQRAEARGQRSSAKGALISGAFDIGSTVLGSAQQFGRLKQGGSFSKSTSSKAVSSGGSISRRASF